MGARSTINRESVWAAAEQLRDQGRAVTQSSVRELLGGGSYTTIGPMLREWTELQSQRVEARDVEIPDAVARVLQEAGGAIWRAAVEESALGLEVVRREVEELRASQQQAEIEHAEIVRIVEAERDHFEARLQGALDEQVHLRELVQVAKNSEVRLSERTARLGDEVDTLKLALSDARERIAVLTDDAKSVAERLREAEDVARRDRERIEDLTDRNATLQADLGSARVDLVQARADLASKSEIWGLERQALNDRLERLSVDHETAQDQLEELESQSAAAAAKAIEDLAARDAVIDQLQRDLKAASVASGQGGEAG